MTTKANNELLIRVDENVKNLVAELTLIRQDRATYEIRLRLVEDAVVKLEPIPSVSHEAVVKDIAFLTSKIDLLEKNKATLQGGWKVILAVSAIVSFLVYTLTNTIHFGIR